MASRLRVKKKRIGPPKKGYMGKAISKATKRLLKPYGLRVKR